MPVSQLKRKEQEMAMVDLKTSFRFDLEKLTEVSKSKDGLSLKNGKKLEGVVTDLLMKQAELQRVNEEIQGLIDSITERVVTKSRSQIDVFSGLRTPSGIRFGYKQGGAVFILDTKNIKKIPKSCYDRKPITYSPNTKGIEDWIKANNKLPAGVKPNPKRTGGPNITLSKEIRLKVSDVKSGNPA